MEIYKKLAKAKADIKNTKMIKRGENTFSRYKYFTPDQISKLVDDVCDDNGLITMFDLKRNELGETGFLTVVDIESGEKVVYELATAIPIIKATNIAQQLGGCVTYTERYLKTSAFGIVDNSLDFDTTQNTKNTVKAIQKAQAKKEDTKPTLVLQKWANKEKGEVMPTYTALILKSRDKGKTPKDLESYYIISEEIKKELEIDLA